MKVVLACGWYYPEGQGGTEGYVAALAHWLVAQGHGVTVVAPEAGVDGARSYQHDGVRVWRYGVTDQPARDESRGSVVARGAEWLHAWLARERADIVHVHAFVTGLGLSEVLAARAAGARVFVTSHAARLGWLCERGTMMQGGTTPCDGLATVAKCTACALADHGAPSAVASAVASLPAAVSAAALAMLPGRAGTMAGMPALIAANLERQRALYAAVEKFVVLTTWARDVVVANGAPPAQVVLNALGCVPPAGGRKPGPGPAPSASPVTVGYVGRFDPVKGLGVLARAFALLPRDLPLRLVLRGPVRSDGERAEHAAWVQIAAQDPRVTVADGVDRAALGDVLRGLDVLVCPSVTAEGGPTIALEAHAVGTPVIGSRLGGLRELVTDGVNGRLVMPGDATALAALLADLARDPTGTVDRWRAALPPTRTMQDVATDTLAMYLESP